jgi:hypothetical protein
MSGSPRPAEDLPSQEHGPAHEALLADALAENAEPRPEELERLLDGCAECRREYAALSKLAQRLDRGAKWEYEVLAGSQFRAAAASARGASGERERFLTRQRREVERTLRASLAPSGARPSLWRRSFPLRVAAAAATVAAATWIVKRLVPHSPSRAQDFMLGPQQAWTGVSARIESDGSITFRWSYDLPPGGWYLLAVEAADASAAVPLAEVRLREGEWKPEPEQCASWPGVVRWRVSAYDASGRSLSTSRESELSLAP